MKTLRTPKLVVVDSNAYWTAALFSALTPSFDVTLFEPRDFRAHAARHDRWHLRSKTETLGANLQRHSQPMPPKFTTWAWPLARRLITSHVRAHAGEEIDILVICFPEYLDLVDALRPRTLIYYNYDDYSVSWPSRADTIRRLEAETVARSDATICIAKQRREDLAAARPAHADKIFHVPIGVTPAFMADSLGAAPTRIEPPAAIATIPRPIAGYVGTLGYRFDFAYLVEVAAQRPDISFVLGGRIPRESEGDAAWRQGLEAARAQPNIHFIGWVEHAELGKYLAGFDALLMVYTECAFNRSACPAKLWDYLGIGLPIIANNRNPETLLWQHVVSIANTPSEFADMLDLALLEGHTRADERLAVARDHTWDRLGACVEKIIAEIGT